MRKVFLFLIFIICINLYAQDMNQARDAGKGLFNSLMTPIGQPLPSNAVKVSDELYTVNDVTNLIKYYYLLNNVVVGYGFAILSQDEDVTFVTFLSFVLGLETYLEKASTLNNGVRTWNYGRYRIQMTNPQSNNTSHFFTIVMMLQ